MTAVLALTGSIGALASAIGPLPGDSFNYGGSSAGVGFEAVLAADHPQAGDGWAFVGCSTPTGTCSYPSTAVAAITIEKSRLPAQYCLVWDPFQPWVCMAWVDQFKFDWYDQAGAHLLPSSCQRYYSTVTGLPDGAKCSLPISGRLPGEYRGELCRTSGASSTCVAELLEVYFKVVAPLCGGLPATIIGTEEADTLEGTAGHDVIVGLGGNDTIDGLGGNDRICAGSGGDVVYGGPGNDRLEGGAGKDRLLGEAGDDHLLGGPGVDRLVGGPGSDTCVGETELTCES